MPGLTISIGYFVTFVFLSLIFFIVLISNLKKEKRNRIIIISILSLYWIIFLAINYKELYYPQIIFEILPLALISFLTILAIYLKNSKKFLKIGWVLCLFLSFYIMVNIQIASKNVSYSGNSFDTVKTTSNPDNSNIKEVTLYKNNKIIFNNDNCTIKDSRNHKNSNNHLAPTYKLTVTKTTFDNGSTQYTNCTLTKSSIK